MNQALKTIVLIAFALSLPCIARCDSSEAQTTAIRELEKQQQDAWNRHDAKAYASLFSEDGDCVNVVGWWWKGRAAIEKKLTAAYAFVFRESVLTITDVDVKFPAPEMGQWSARALRKLFRNRSRVFKPSYCKSRTANG